MKGSIRHTRKTVGVLINEIDGWYGSLIIKGIRKVARDRNINLVVFPGRSINSAWRDEAQHNIIYNIVNKEKLDGIIITSASLFYNIGIKESDSFLDTFKDIPIVSISVEVTNTHSVIFDNKSSMYSIVNHLIEHHSYRNIAFILGPSSSLEARQRYEGYLEALKEHNIPIDKSYIAEGDFTEESGTKAVETLFQKIMVKPQAIVSSNDQMAIGASIKLKEMGFKIGQDIALTGFDNSDEIKFFSPPLTTVSQPTFQLGSMAAEFICDLLEGKQVEMCTHIKGELVVRQSCGCLNIPYKKTLVNGGCILDNKTDFLMHVQSFRDRVEHNREDIILQLLQQLNAPFSEKSETGRIISNLIDDINGDLDGGNIKGRFIENLNYVLNENMVLKSQPLNWNNFILSFREIVLQYAASHEVYSLLEDIFYTACILANNILIRLESKDSYNFRKLFREDLQTSEDFNAALNLEDLVNILKKYISKVAIEKCYLCLYDNPVTYLSGCEDVLPQKVKLFLCYDKKDEPSVEYFDTIEMLPDKYLYTEDINELLYIPLFTGNTHFGFIVFSMKDIDENVFESLRKHISHALNSQLLLNERKRAEEELQVAVKKLEKLNNELHNLSIIDELTGLNNRRGFHIKGNEYYEWASSNNESFIILYGDLDGLKKINDSFGHKYGDEALKTAGKLLQKSFRNSDILSRLGGDEFIALAINIPSPNTLKIILDKINYNFNKFNSGNTLPFKVSMSIGYSIFEPGSKLSFDELIQEADTSLYEEKKRKKYILKTF